VQRLGRLLSTRHKEVQLAGRGRLVLPEGFREFLGVEPGGEAMLVGAAVCVEIWQPEKWRIYVGEEMPAFRKLLDELSG
jgi:MraZ protein